MVICSPQLRTNKKNEPKGKLKKDWTLSKLRREISLPPCFFQRSAKVHLCSVQPRRPIQANHEQFAFSFQVKLGDNSTNNETTPPAKQKSSAKVK
jgi:hypothetical protein